MRRPQQGATSWRALGNARDFQLVYGEGVKYVGRLFVLYLYPGADCARAVVASRKVGNAVHRNRAKRLLREALRVCIERRPDLVRDLRQRHWPDRFPASTLWVVMVARVRILGAACDDVITELDRMLEPPVQGGSSDTRA